MPIVPRKVAKILSIFAFGAVSAILLKAVAKRALVEMMALSYGGWG